LLGRARRAQSRHFIAEVRALRPHDTRHPTGPGADRSPRQRPPDPL